MLFFWLLSGHTGVCFSQSGCHLHPSPAHAAKYVHPEFARKFKMDLLIQPPSPLAFPKWPEHTSPPHSCFPIFTPVLPPLTPLAILSLPPAPYFFFFNLGTQYLSPKQDLHGL